MFNLNTYVHNVVIKNDVQGLQQPWINPHINLAEQLGYYQANLQQGVQPQKASVSYDLFCEDSLSGGREELITFWAFTLSGNELISFAKNDPNRFLTAYLVAANKLTVAGQVINPWDITVVKQGMIQGGLKVKENRLVDFQNTRLFSETFVNSRSFSVSELLSSDGEKDLSIFIAYGSQVEGLDALRLYGFRVQDIVGKFYSTKMFDILMNKEIVESDDSFVQDNRMTTQINELWSENNTLDLLGVNSMLDQNVFTALSVDSQYFKTNTWSDIVLTKINNDYGYFFGYNTESFLKNESMYYKLLKSRGAFKNNLPLLKSVLSRCKVAELKIVRQRVVVTETVNELGAPCFNNRPFDDSWDDGVEEIISLGGDADGASFLSNEDFDRISEIIIKDNTDGLMRYFNGVDTSIKNKTMGYYRIGAYLKMRDGVQEYFRELFFNFTRSYRWFQEYHSDIINNNYIDVYTGFLKTLMADKLITKYATYPPWDEVINNMGALLYAVTGQSVILNKILSSLATWIKPHSCTDSSLGDFVKIVDNIQNTFSQFLKMQSQENFIVSDHWFNEQLMDAKSIEDGSVLYQTGEHPSGYFLETTVNDLPNLFPGSIILDGKMFVVPSFIAYGEVKVPIKTSTPEGAKHLESVLTVINESKVMGGLNFAGTSGAYSGLPSSDNKPQATIDSTVGSGGKVFGTLGITLEAPKLQNFSNVVMAADNRMVIDYDGTTQVVGSKTLIENKIKKNTEVERKFSTALLSTVLQKKPTFTKSPIGTAGLRDVMVEDSPFKEYKPPLEYWGPGSSNQDEMVGIQYFDGYTQRSNGEYDIKARRWVYLRPEAIRELVISSGKIFLCRLHKENLGDLQMHTDNEFFFLAP
jgi:hypothetical protein